MTTITIDQVSKFLLGEAPLDGVWFGDKHPEKRGWFWWRKHLRDALAAQPEHKHTEAEVKALLDAGEKLATMRYSDGEFEQYVRRILGVPKP